MMQEAKDGMIAELKSEVLRLQGLRSAGGPSVHTGLGMIEKAFSGGQFPVAAVHEFVSMRAADAAATNGFIAGLLGGLMQHRGACLWVSLRRLVYPPALRFFGIDPERILFVDAASPRQALWTIEEALRCPYLSVVVGELQELSFTDSRRLQLAVERSKVTGLIHRIRPRNIQPTAAVSRWQISTVASLPEEGMPGVGDPRWQVQLTKVRNGRPGSWVVEWQDHAFKVVGRQIVIPDWQTRKTG